MNAPPPDAAIAPMVDPTPACGAADKGCTVNPDSCCGPGHCVPQYNGDAKGICVAPGGKPNSYCTGTVAQSTCASPLMCCTIASGSNFGQCGARCCEATPSFPCVVGAPQDGDQGCCSPLECIPDNSPTKGRCVDGSKFGHAGEACADPMNNGVGTCDPTMGLKCCTGTCVKTACCAVQDPTAPTGCCAGGDGASCTKGSHDYDCCGAFTCVQDTQVSHCIMPGGGEGLRCIPGSCAPGLFCCPGPMRFYVCSATPCPMDGGVRDGMIDAGLDAGIDAGLDAGVDASLDATMIDATMVPIPDAGPCVPLPSDQYGPAMSLQSQDPAYGTQGAGACSTSCSATSTVHGYGGTRGGGSSGLSPQYLYNYYYQWCVMQCINDLACELLYNFNDWGPLPGTDQRMFSISCDCVIGIP